MESMEKKLADYRKRKEREKYMEETKLKAKAFFTKYISMKKTMDVTDHENETSENIDKKILEDIITESEVSDNEEEDVKCCSYIDWIYYTLFFTLWLILYIIFIKLEFGLVYFAVSGLILMYLNTRTNPKKSNETSAYSVFNKNCESIDGTLKAEQFEKELMYRPSLGR